MDDLIERLRLIAAWHKPGGPTPKEGMPNRTKTCLEAADRIAALEADNARLMGLVKEAGDHMAEQITHIETRIADGDEMGARVWRITLEDVARESRATLAKIKETPDA